MKLLMVSKRTLMKDPTIVDNFDGVWIFGKGNPFLGLLVKEEGEQGEVRETTWKNFLMHIEKYRKPIRVIKKGKNERWLYIPKTKETRETIKDLLLKTEKILVVF